MKHGRAARSPGFTLVEMLFVMVIIGVLAGISTPRIMDWIAASRVDNAANVVASDLRLAVSLASRQGTPVEIEFDVAAMEYTFEDMSGNVLHRREIGAGTEVPIQSATASPATVKAFPNRVTSEKISITLAAGDHSRLVEMTSAGFVTVTTP